MENNYSTFNSNSFFAGFMTGLFIQWTNIVPVLGAFVLGLSIRNLPEVLDLRALPNNFSGLLNLFFSLRRHQKESDEKSLSMLGDALSSSELKKPKIQIKTKK